MYTMYMKNKNWSRSRLDILYNVDGRTLQEIGDLYGVSRERVRQVMEGFGLARGLNREKGKSMGYAPYKTLEEYFDDSNQRMDIGTPIIRRLLGDLPCSECGKRKNIHIHHIVYPATSLRDIQVLCASCHHTKHRKGITYLIQIDIYNQYLRGETTLALAGKYGVNRNLIYAILRKIRNGNGSLKGKNRFGRMSRTA